jgi:predicted small metal-binding protein
MKTLACKDMEVDCGYIAKGETEEEVIGKMNDHAMKAHPDVVAEMSKEMSKEEMANKMISKMKDA